MAKPLVYINGCPGVGKLTVAQLLPAHLGDKVAVKVVQNHLLIDPAEAICSRDHPAYQPLRRELRQAVLRAIANFPDIIFIFTDFQGDNPLGRSVCEEYQAAAKLRGSTFIPISLTCNVDENVRRAASAARSAVSTHKLTDPELVADLSKRCPVYTPNVPEALFVDTTSMEPNDVAARIAAHVIGLSASAHGHLVNGITSNTIPS